jgi:hypothetical protein
MVTAANTTEKNVAILPTVQIAYETLRVTVYLPLFGKVRVSISLIQ